MRARGPALAAPTGALATLLALGCDPELVGERGDFALSFPGLQARSFGRWPAPQRIAEGSRLCPVLRCETCPEGQDCSAAPISAAGPITAEGDGCFVVDGPGEVVWSVGQPCGAADQPPDRAVLQAFALADLRPVLVGELDQLVLDHPDASSAGPPWSAVPPAPLRVVAGSQVRFPVELRAADDGMAVYTGGEVQWTTTSGRPPVAYPSSALELVAFADTAAAAAFRLGDRTWPLGPVLGVQASAAASLELAAAIDPGSGTGVARALARDAEGRLLHGLPVTWSRVRGDLAPDPSFPNQDYLWLADSCRPPEARGGPREAVLRAEFSTASRPEFGELSAEISLRWDGVAGEPDPAWAPDDACDEAGGCGCTSAPGPAAPALLVLCALLLRRRRRRDLSLGALCTLALAPACGEPPALRAAASRELGALAWDPRIQGRDGGYSARVGDRVLWVFGDTGATKAPSALPGFLNNTACSTVDLDASDGLFPLVENLQGDYPLEFLPMTDDEVAHELAHSGPDCGDACEGVAMWPGPVIPDPERGRVLVFYAKLLQRPGFLNISVLGTSLAVWDDSLPPQAERPIVAPGSAEPSLLFGADEPGLAAAAFAEDGTLYAYTCDGDGFTKPCRLARAPLADPLRRERWEFYAGEGDWSADWRRADKLFQGAPIMSVHPKPGLGAYVAVYAEPGGTDIVVRTAPAPEGPWSDEEVIHRPLMPVAEPFVYGAILHPELAREGGTFDYLTYYLDQTGTIQLVEIEWQRSW